MLKNRISYKEKFRFSLDYTMLVLLTAAFFAIAASSIEIIFPLSAARLLFLLLLSFIMAFTVSITGTGFRLSRAYAAGALGLAMFSALIVLVVL